MKSKMKEIQNQEEMLQLQYYARYLYNSAESLYIFKVVNLILNCILAVTNAPALIIIIATITVLGINWLINCCINRAAEAREIFDCELFGFEGMPYYLIAVAIGYMESGYFGLYHSQTVKYSKMEPEEINQKVRE